MKRALLIVIVLGCCVQLELLGGPGRGRGRFVRDTEPTPAFDEPAGDDVPIPTHCAAIELAIADAEAAIASLQFALELLDCPCTDCPPAE